ncbi:MAG TPA: LLM class F420-dependent oxidoreductase [Candidatus Binatia bacterium]|nr:LLM class F420-dependent oxidoreductase [Candidatus Binatia bacterium]
MRFGLFGINMGPCAAPAAAASVARAAERAGFDSLWAGEHVVLPDPQAPPSPAAPEMPMLDPAVALGFVASHTERVRLGTGIIILPQRNPLVLAKELASLDVVSGGRLIFGVGIGYLKAEFDALNVSFEHKGPRSEEFLRAMIAIWDEEKPRFQGRFFSFSGVQAFPRPVQRPHPAIVFGGHTPPAFRRAARLASGWYGFALDHGATAKCLEQLRAACAEAGRRFEDLEISVTPRPGRGAPSLDDVRRYAELGVHRLILFPAAAPDEASVLRYVAEAEHGLVGKV